MFLWHHIRTSFGHNTRLDISGTMLRGLLRWVSRRFRKRCCRSLLSGSKSAGFFEFKEHNGDMVWKRRARIYTLDAIKLLRRVDRTAYTLVQHSEVLADFYLEENATILFPRQQYCITDAPSRCSGRFVCGLLTTVASWGVCLLKSKADRKAFAMYFLPASLLLRLSTI